MSSGLLHGRGQMSAKITGNPKKSGLSSTPKPVASGDYRRLASHSANPSAISGCSPMSPRGDLMRRQTQSSKGDRPKLNRLRLPPVTVSHLDSDFELEGLAMRVPENRHLRASAGAEPRETPRQSIHVQLVETGTNVSHAEELHSFCEMQLRDAKEREVRFKTKLAVLDKLVAELKANISEKEEKIAQVEGQLVQQEAALAEEISRSKAEGEELREKLSSRVKRVDEMFIGHQKEINALKKEHQQELEIRDAKMTQLKTQLEKAMDSKAWERQQQLEELSKELARVTEETEMLKIALRSYKSKTNVEPQTSCPNCHHLMAKLDEKPKVSERDVVTTLKSALNDG